jgi:para-nitrobenzyl esterase
VIAVTTPSAATILDTVRTTLAPLGLSGSGPIREGTVIPASAIAAINAGRYCKVPLLASNTHDEGKLLGDFLALSPALGGKPGFIVDEATRLALMTTFDPDAAPSLRDSDLIDPSYLPVATPESGYTARTDMLNRIFFIANRDSILTALKARQAELWYFQFDWDMEPAPWNDVYGATHAIELPFVFGNFDAGVLSKVVAGKANQSGRLALSSVMMSSIGAFARNGDPNHAALGLAWPAWPQRIHFAASLSAAQISSEVGTR